MMTITKADLTRILHNAASKDMGIARRDAKRADRIVGLVAITGTKRGNVELQFDPNSKLYSLQNFNTGESYFQEWNATATRYFLADNYEIALENTEVV